MSSKRENYIEMRRTWVKIKDENISNHRYIGTSILRIYRDISADILEKNIGKLKIVKNSWKCKENLIII